MDNSEYIQAFSNIADVASKIHTLCCFSINHTEASKKDVQTMFEIIDDYSEDILQIADSVIG